MKEYTMIRITKELRQEIKKFAADNELSMVDAAEYIVMTGIEKEKTHE